MAFKIDSSYDKNNWRYTKKVDKNHSFIKKKQQSQ